MGKYEPVIIGILTALVIVATITLFAMGKDKVASSIIILIPAIPFCWVFGRIIVGVNRQ